MPILIRRRYCALCPIFVRESFKHFPLFILWLTELKSNVCAVQQNYSFVVYAWSRVVKYANNCSLWRTNWPTLIQKKCIGDLKKKWQEKEVRKTSRSRIRLVRTHIRLHSETPARTWFRQFFIHLHSAVCISFSLSFSVSRRTLSVKHRGSSVTQLGWKSSAGPPACPFGCSMLIAF